MAAGVNPVLYKSAVVMMEANKVYMGNTQKESEELIAKAKANADGGIFDSFKTIEKAEENIKAAYEKLFNDSHEFMSKKIKDIKATITNEEILQALESMTKKVDNSMTKVSGAMAGAKK